jgi:hypothetical protein
MCIVARGVVHWASRTTIVAVRCLSEALVTSWASASTSHCSSSYGSESTDQWLAITASLLLVVVLVVVVVVAAPSSVTS